MALTAGITLAIPADPRGRTAAPGSGLLQPDRVEVLIAFLAPPGPAEQTLVRTFGGVVTYTYHLVPAIASSIPRVAVSALRADPRVAVVEPDDLVYALHHEAELDNTWGVKRIGAGTVHHGGNGGTDARVAVIDSGIDYTHLELGGSFAGGWDFVNGDPDPWDDNGHGTHVAGTIAAAFDGVGVVGAAPAARLYGLKVLNAQGVGSWSRVIAALEWAVDNGIQVTNNSYAGGIPWSASIVQAAFENAEAAGVLHVAAAGNSGTCEGTTESVRWPAASRSVIAVGATDVNDIRACFSGTGAGLEQVAPGVGIKSTIRYGGYGISSGTSMASPHVAAASALVIAAGVADRNGNGRVNDDVREILAATSRDMGAPGRDPQYGYGLVDAAAAVAAVRSGPSLTVALTTDRSTYENGPGKTAMLSVMVADEVGQPTGRLDAEAFATLVDGKTVAVIFAETKTTGLYIGELDISSLVEGTHRVAVTVTDVRGISASDSASFTVAPTPDAMPPTVAITTPADGGAVFGIVAMAADAADDVGVSGVQFMIDGVPMAAEDTTAPFEIVWDTTTVTDDAHTLTARARDEAGHDTTSAPVTVTVANAPTIAGFTPTSGPPAPLSP